MNDFQPLAVVLPQKGDARDLGSGRRDSIGRGVAWLAVEGARDLLAISSILGEGYGGLHK